MDELQLVSLYVFIGKVPDSIKTIGTIQKVVFHRRWDELEARVKWGNYVIRHGAKQHPPKACMVPGI